jgi:hypothetical protein
VDKVPCIGQIFHPNPRGDTLFKDDTSSFVRNSEDKYMPANERHSDAYSSKQNIVINCNALKLL